MYLHESRSLPWGCQTCVHRGSCDPVAVIARGVAHHPGSCADRPQAQARRVSCPTQARCTALGAAARGDAETRARPVPRPDGVRRLGGALARLRPGRRRDGPGQPRLHPPQPWSRRLSPLRPRATWIGSNGSCTRWALPSTSAPASGATQLPLQMTSVPTGPSAVPEASPRHPTSEAEVRCPWLRIARAGRSGGRRLRTG